MNKQNKGFVVITGTSSGIGLCCVKEVKNAGFEVIATVRRNADFTQLDEIGIQHKLLLDLSDSDSIEAAVKKIKEVSGGAVYALFNNGAYGQPGAVEDLSRQALREQFETNFFGTHELTTKLLPLLLKSPSARIIQNSSVLGFAAMPMRGAYNASKFALEGLTDTLRLELAETSNIKVSLIEPGPITSKFRANALVALHKNIDMDSSRHSEVYKASLARLENEGPNSRFTLPPEAVAKKLLHALNSTKPKARYYVTFPTYLFAFLRHFLSTKMMDKLLLKAGNA